MTNVGFLKRLIQRRRPLTSSLLAFSLIIFQFIFPFWCRWVSRVDGYLIFFADFLLVMFVEIMLKRVKPLMKSSNVPYPMSLVLFDPARPVSQ